MSYNFRDDIMEGLKDYFESQINKHKVNINIMIENGVGVAEHPDTMETIEKELEKMAEYEDKLAVLVKYFIED